MLRRAVAALIFVSAGLVASAQPAQGPPPSIDISLFAKSMHWRNIGPTPNAEISHIATDSAFPYRVCATQHGGDAVCVASRGDSGAITLRDWHPVGADAAGFAAPDPNDPDTVFSGRLNRFDRRTTQTYDVSPPAGDLAQRLGSGPAVFPVAESRSLLYGMNALWKTVNGGQTWTALSSDLTRGRGAISAVAPSPVDPAVIWVGTDDGLVHLTRDSGKTWTNVTPPLLTPGDQVVGIDTSHFDTNGAYIAIVSNNPSERPHRVLRTRNGGATWSPMTRGLPDNALVHVVREDTLRRGLLFAGSSNSVHVSFDDGESWQSLGLNLPLTSVRDLVVKNDDLVIGTGNRGLWILDDISPLRQTTADVITRARTFLFRPAAGWRVRTNALARPVQPADTPAMPNPPDGVAVDYLLDGTVTGAVSLDILVPVPATSTSPSTTRLIRSFSSGDGRYGLSATPGLHRFIWDLRLAPPAGGLDLRGAWVLPGTYVLRLTVNGRVFSQAVTVRLDPRVKTPMADLALQHNLSRKLTELIQQLGDAKRTRPSAAIDAAYAPLTEIFIRLQDADVRPTAAVEAAANAAIAKADAALAVR